MCTVDEKTPARWRRIQIDYRITYSIIFVKNFDFYTNGIV